MHDLSLVYTIAAAFTSAWILGLLTQRLRLSPIVGYLLAGVLIGPHTPGFVGDVHLAQQLAEVGVILLMFGVGLHFHVKDLLAVKNVAIPGAVGQSLVATLLAMVIFAGFDLPWKTGAVMGMALAVASTVVLMRVLMDQDLLNSPQGHVAVGWLLVEDLFTVVLLVLIPVLGEGNSQGTVAGGAGGFSLVWVLGLTFLKLGVLVAVVLLAGSRLVPWVLVQVARLRSRELFTLTILVFSIAVAAGSYFFFGASMALGAFLAGMLVAQSPVSHQAAADALPLRDAFAVLFFVSVGMLFDPAVLLLHPLMVAAALGIVLLAKPLSALLIVVLLGHSSRTALTVAIGLGQIGEFSFILSDLARRHGLMPEAGHGVLVAAAIISITLNPLLFRSIPRVESWIRARPRLWRLLNGRAERRGDAVNLGAAQALARSKEDNKRLAIVVGYGPVGRSVHRLLREANRQTVVIDLNMDTVSALWEEGHTAIFGDASRESILEQAGVRSASHVVITLSSSVSKAVVAAARNQNAGIRILVRARYLSEREDLEQAGANAAVFEEAEAAVALSRLVLADSGLHRRAADEKIKDLRLRLITENREEEYPHESQASLVEALARGGVILDLTGETIGQAVPELVNLIRVESLPAGTAKAEVIRLVLEREREISTDLGNGVAIPHAEVAGLAAPIVIVGRSGTGIRFDLEAPELVHLLFVLITPVERPESQLSLLSQVARLCRKPSVRDSLLQADSKEEVAALVAAEGRPTLSPRA